MAALTSTSINPNQQFDKAIKEWRKQWLKPYIKADGTVMKYPDGSPCLVTKYEGTPQFKIDTSKGYRLSEGTDLSFDPNTLTVEQMVVKSEKKVLYSIPAKFVSIIKQGGLMCTKCTYQYRADKKLIDEAKPATHICVLNNSETYCLVCQQCKKDGLYAHNYEICIDTYIPFTQFL